MKKMVALLVIVILSMTTIVSAQEEDPRVGYEILQIVSLNEFVTWVNTDGITQEEFDAIDLPVGWIKNQPRQILIDGGSFASSPYAAEDEYVIEEHFGHMWLHVATVVEANAPIDDEGLLRANTIVKSHEVMFDAGRVLSVLISPNDEHYALITRDNDRTTDTFTLPEGWQLVDVELTEALTVQLPNPTINIRTDNEDSFQGPIAELAFLTDGDAMANAMNDDLCFAELEVMTTADGVEFVRTPDACFENLPDWDYNAQYVEIDGLRQAYAETGTGESGETILLLHGQPSWSYLYRKMMPVLADAGHRVIAMDHLGMGRSDKPIDPDYYTYIDHTERLEAFITELGLDETQLTVFVQDWGSLIGLQVVGTNPDWFDRLVVGNGFLPTFPEGSVPFELPDNPLITRNLFHRAITTMPAQQEPLVREPLDIESTADFDNDGNYFGLWIDYARNDERFRPEVIIESQTYFDLTPEEEAGYAAPFPSYLAMGGARAFPGLVNELPSVTDSGWAGLGEFDQPFLTIWGDNDGGNLGEPFIQQTLIDHIPGSAGFNHIRLPEASHFLQDDAGETIATMINRFIEQTPDAMPVEQLSANNDGLPATYQAQIMPIPQNMRDFRYCEILVVSMQETIVAGVYNTLGHNDCPDDIWSTYDAEALAEQYGVTQAVLNGPRYWVINEIEGNDTSQTSKVVNFNGMEMRLVAQLELDLSAIARSRNGENEKYSITEVQRSTTYTYYAENMVYELTSPEGDVYRMQAYSQIVDPELTIDDLETLGERLDLPEGWTYEARVLDETEELIVDGLAFVIQDDFNNTYQKLSVLDSATSDTSQLMVHDGYWVAEIQQEGMPLPVISINDTHVNPETGRVTVYAQAILGGNIIAPVQVGPGEFTEHISGEIVGFHPNAVYLNGSGQELSESDGTGSWWVKHSWVIDGEGYYNWELTATDYERGGSYAQGTLLDDGLTMKMQASREGAPEAIAQEFYGNLRIPILDTNPVTYEIVRYGPANIDPEAGPVDYTSTPQFTVVMTCIEEVSAFDNQVRACPVANN